MSSRKVGHLSRASILQNTCLWMLLASFQKYANILQRYLKNYANDKKTKIWKGYVYKKVCKYQQL